MTTKYGPRIAHQGGPDCPCDPGAAGRVWQSARVLYQFEKMKAANWSDVLVYQLVEEPVRETVVQEGWAYLEGGFINFSRYKISYPPERSFVRFTTNLEDGLPVSGSWEAVE